MTRPPAASPLAAAVIAALCAVAVGAAPCAAQAPPPPRVLRESPWNGDWVLSPSRNPAAIKAEAADGYRFTLAPGGAITWEIPSLHEVVHGRTDGAPMPIRRPGAPAGLTLSVKSEGARTLLYTVARDGRPDGEGRMTLVDQDRAWVDISQPYGRPDLAGVVIYVRPGAP